MGANDLFTGKYEWDVILENNDACHSIGFGICKRQDLLKELQTGWTMKELQGTQSLILIQASG